MSSLIKTKLRFKLALLTAISVTIGLSLVGSFLYIQYKNFLYNRVEEVLVQFLELSEQSLYVERIATTDTGYLKQFVDESARITGCRFTIIDPEGRVLADSEIPIAELGSVENHIDRPEVQESLRSGIGFSTRTSETINRDLNYVSKVLRRDGEVAGFLRLALFAEETNEMLDTGRRFFVLGGLFILVISAIFVTLLTRRINRNLDEAIQKAHRIASGDLDVKIELDSRDEIGELGGSLTIMANQLSRNLRKLSRERQDLNTVLTSINEGIIAINPDQKIIFFNNRALQFLDIPIQSIRGQDYREVIRNEHLRSMIEIFMEKPLFISDEVRIDDDRVVEVVITPAQIDEDRDEAGAVIVCRDISHFKKLEKIRRDFVGNVTHEFKTPLAAIQGYAETLLDWGLEDETISRKYLKKIVKQSHQLENLVSDLLQLARIERLQNLEMHPFDPDPVMIDIVQEFEELASAKQITVELNLPGDQDPVVGEPEMFRSIFSNLVDNALKYTPDGGRIFISSHEERRHRVIAVRDTGIGIPDKYHSRIFERFYRVDKARSRSIGGTGLGLSIVKHLAELQNAKVSLESEVNVGSTFYLTFQSAAGHDGNSVRTTDLSLKARSGS